ncbi:hypothetical protein CBS101457_003960 [Exobasidium rhododendri]|nr:hypothetical protein CBS101457_003960 [Exobasidium rhododendri]
MASAEASSSSTSAPIFKKRSSRPTAGSGSRSLIRGVGIGEARPAKADEAGDDAELALEQGPTLEDLISIRSLRSRPIGIELSRLNKGEIRKKKKKNKSQETSAKESTEEEKWAEQMQKGGLTKRSTDRDEEAEENGKSSNAPRLVKQNNFQGETGTVDVDKHMMAYIEEEMQKRRQPGEMDNLPNNVAATEGGKAVSNPQDELFSIAEKYRKIQEKGNEEKEEGNATFSQAMLTGVPEIDLGIDLRMKNIQDTEKARRAMLEAQKLKSKDMRGDEDADFASARFFKYGTKIQSDADILRKGIEFGPNGQPLPVDDKAKRSSDHKRQTATDDAALERFKKRQRNQLKR